LNGSFCAGKDFNIEEERKKIKKKTIISASPYIFLPHKSFKNEGDIVRIKTPSSKPEYGHQTTSHATKRKRKKKTLDQVQRQFECKGNLVI